MGLAATRTRTPSRPISLGSLDIKSFIVWFYSHGYWNTNKQKMWQFSDFSCSEKHDREASLPGPPLVSLSLDLPSLPITNVIPGISSWEDSSLWSSVTDVTVVKSLCELQASDTLFYISSREPSVSLLQNPASSDVSSVPTALQGDRTKSKCEMSPVSYVP